MENIPCGTSDRKPDVDSVVEIWRDELTRKIERARVRFELIGLDPDEQDTLAREVAEFKRVCRGLRWLSNIGETASDQREAA